jgi:hypothetical protein
LSPQSPHCHTWLVHGISPFLIMQNPLRSPLSSRHWWFPGAREFTWEPAAESGTLLREEAFRVETVQAPTTPRTLEARNQPGRIEPFRSMR